jgi:hypothetical protein
MPNITTIGTASAKAYGFTANLGASPTGTYFLTVLGAGGYITGAGYIKTAGGYALYGRYNSSSAYPYNGVVYSGIVNNVGDYVSSTVTGIGGSPVGFTSAVSFSNPVEDGYGNVYIGGESPSPSGGFSIFATAFIADLTIGGPSGVAPDPVYGYVASIDTLRVSPISSTTIWGLGYGPDFGDLSCSPSNALLRTLYKFTTSASSTVVVTKNFFTGQLYTNSLNIAPGTGYVSVIGFLVATPPCCCYNYYATDTFINIVNSDNTAGILKLSIPKNSGNDNAQFVYAKIDSVGNVWALVQQETLTNYYLTLVKFDSVGNVLFQRKWTAGAYSASYPPNYFDIVFDKYKNAYVVYKTPTTAYKTAILKFNSYGTIQYTRNLYSTQTQYGNTCGFLNLGPVGIENDASIVITGSFISRATSPSAANLGLIRLPANGSLTQTFTLGVTNATDMVYESGGYVATSNSLSFTISAGAVIGVNSVSTPITMDIDPYTYTSTYQVEIL